MSYCEHCEKEYDGLVCPVCGAELLQEVDPESMPREEGRWTFGFPKQDEAPWPHGSDGQPEEVAFLINLSDYAAVEKVVLARLQAAGIPVLTRYPGAGGLGKIYLGFSGYGISLYVPVSREAEARSLLRV